MSIMYTYENDLYAKGYTAVCGTDEAGAGPLAGPVYAAAVILDRDSVIDGLNDSKKLSEKKREKLFDEIIAKARAYAIVSIPESVIDDINILNARMLAMRKAVSELDITPDFLLVDGNRDPGAEVESLCVIGGDGKSASVAAASILAKVSRDRFMLKMAEEYPQYKFEKHKGYGTKVHIEAIRQFGPCPIHRKSFLKNICGGER